MVTNHIIQEDTRGIRYNHARYNRRRKFLRFLLKYIGVHLLARIDSVQGIENVPKSGPAILMINHINFIDPFVVMAYLPRNIVPMAKIEVYSYPALWVSFPVCMESSRSRGKNLIGRQFKAPHVLTATADPRKK